jgi:lipopolysaccharide biosynthesis glycosyltransferase
MNVHLALAADRNMEVGLHVTLYTALKFLHPDCSTTIHLFVKDFSDRAINRLHQTLAPYIGRYDLKVTDARGLNLGNGRCLYSSKMPYASLVAANLIDAERILFLDADLLVLMDVSEIFSHELDGKTAGVVFLNKVAEVWSEEYTVLKKIGLADDLPYFSSGVVLFDAKKWKEKKLTEKCFEIIDQYSSELRNTDQTVLNAALGGDVFLLPDNYHRIFYAGGWSVDINTSNCICHLGGAPKPWDFLGELLNNSYPAFQQYLKETAFSNYKS